MPVTTDRLKFNPVLGVPPVLQWCAPTQLAIDKGYQRSIDNRPSQRLINQIATHWDWGLCQPLVVNRRPGSGGGGAGELFVIDGQHRLAAARLRRDIAHLPCVILDLPEVADEAASFVHLNQRRRPLSKLNVFKAALASGDRESSAIARALGEAGLSIATSTNPDSWKPGCLVNIGGLQATYRRHGVTRLRATLHVFAGGFGGQVLRYAGTIYPGVAALVAELTEKRDPLIWKESEQAVMLAEMLGETPQHEWREQMLRAMAETPSLKFAEASAKVIGAAWADLMDSFGDEEDPTFDQARTGELVALAQAEE